MGHYDTRKQFGVPPKGKIGDSISFSEFPANDQPAKGEIDMLSPNFEFLVFLPSAKVIRPNVRGLLPGPPDLLIVAI
jgi:hypothetical protein